MLPLPCYVLYDCSPLCCVVRFTAVRPLLDVQDQLGVELMVLVEDPQTATIRRIVAEAAAQLAAAAPMPATSVPHSHPFAVHINAHSGSSSPAVTSGRVQLGKAALAAPAWISPAPFAVKMRLFCLPYAGGVSENVFAR